MTKNDNIEIRRSQKHTANRLLHRTLYWKYLQRHKALVWCACRSLRAECDAPPRRTRRRRKSCVTRTRPSWLVPFCLPSHSVTGWARLLRQLDAQYVIFAVSSDRRATPPILNKRPANSPHSSAHRRKILEQRQQPVGRGSTGTGVTASPTHTVMPDDCLSQCADRTDRL